MVSCLVPECDQDSTLILPPNQCCPICRGTMCYTSPACDSLLVFSDLCAELNCISPGYECRVDTATSSAFCAPVCVPGSCPLGQQCSISLDILCKKEPCPGILNCRPSQCSTYVCSTPVIYVAPGHVI